MKLSKNFTLKELTRSDTARARGIDNTPTPLVVDNLQTLCVNLLQPLRDELNKPVHIASGYRCERLNDAVGGVRNSQHATGQAADIIVAGMTKDVLFEFIKSSALSVDQCIRYNNKNIVHVSYVDVNSNREQYLEVRIDT